MSVSVLIAAEFPLSPALEAEWLARLPLPRRAEIGRWQDGRARHRSLLGSRLLAQGLHGLGYPETVLSSLWYPPLSRPTLDVPLDFSLSHCDGRIVCALSTSGPVGIDVEGLGDLTAEEFRVYLSAAERAWAGRSTRRFYSVWTRKEAVAKAAGSRGLRDMVRVETTLAEQGASFAGRLWRTRSLPVGRRYVAHLALADEPDRVIVSHVGRSALERDFQPTDGDASLAPPGSVL